MRPVAGRLPGQQSMSCVRGSMARSLVAAHEEACLPGLGKPLPAVFPVVSTVGLEGEGQLRRLRRLSVADVLARFVSQVLGQSATLLDVPVAEGLGEVARGRLIPDAVTALDQLPRSRLVEGGDQLTLNSDDLLEFVLAAGKAPRWPEAIVSAQRAAVGGSRGALVRFARTDGGGDIEVFTTRPDTLFGASFVAVSSNHAAAQLAEPARLAAFRAECRTASGEAGAKAGVPLGLSVRHPLVPGRVLPLWLANFVVEDYGTGAAGGCPACDQRDLDFARRYGLPVYSIICPPGKDPATYQVGASAHAGDGVIINSGFLTGLPVANAIDTAIAALARAGRGRPAVHYRRRPFVVAEAASAGKRDVCRLGRPWRFAGTFLTAAALVAPAPSATWRPHMLHVTAPETAARHLLDARILLHALQDGHGLTYQEPWEEIVLIGGVTGSSVNHGPQAPAWDSEAFRLAVLADTPPGRELKWDDRRYAVALRFVEATHRLFSLSGRAQGIDKVCLAGKVAKASAALESALSRRRTNTAVAAIREIVAGAAESAQGTGLDSSAQTFVASLLYPLLPELAGRGLAAAGVPIPPAWPHGGGQASGTEPVELIVQINGKKRGTVRVARDADRETVIAAIRANRSLNAHLGENSIRKAIVVPDRLVNLVI
jgi:leucyl-tRNA synthetase